MRRRLICQVDHSPKLDHLQCPIYRTDPLHVKELKELHNHGLAQGMQGSMPSLLPRQLQQLRTAARIQNWLVLIEHTVNTVPGGAQPNPEEDQWVDLLLQQPKYQS